MAEIVAGFGVPHTPIFPFFAERDGPDCEIARLFRTLTGHLEEIRPDLIVMFDTDHLNTFFLDNLPVFAIGVGDDFEGPIDEVRSVPVQTVKSRGDVAAHLRTAAVHAGFDVALAQEFKVDHSVFVPLHFMTPKLDIPVIPVFIAGHVPPLPPARRCYALGQAIGQAVKSWREPLRVVMFGSGSFSLEVWGPRIEPGRNDGVPDRDWVTRVLGLMRNGDIETLLDAATEAQLLKAGNVGGEILNWIAMLGAIGGERKPNWMEPQMNNGHAYGVWRWS
jgi:aromatic ring-opening dioxygenase catalytic subunit (LigB family)